MHISEGILPAQICIAGYGITGLATWYSLRQINRQNNPTEGIPKASLLTAAFFVASSLHIPIPPASVHLVLNGLLGAVLGCYAFPAILIGLIFQAIVFGHGGLTTLGVNATIMGVPALVAAALFQLRNRFADRMGDALALNVFGFLSGAIGVGLAATIFFTLVITNLPSGFDTETERTAIVGLMIAHVPLMGIEGVFTAMVVSFLSRVKPELLVG
ncbi:cobalt transporter CbiM [Lyngbya sp. CCY1209]|uniref:cobalt transporter CbiM n=1 Tax=Lyngbya sp. CCY1209 TaxID=2886103 RepID=UPI002D210362|nr:cobalt transporter CbiM [Lyngbya sp. CCY1209]MEB3887448.1 cobalt transporter CbiM [Lyngbya sp. CCY1209]